LSGREARLCAPSGNDSSGQNQWAALCAAHEMASEKPKSMVLVSLYNSARTYFIKNLWKNPIAPPPQSGTLPRRKIVFSFRRKSGRA